MDDKAMRKALDGMRSRRLAALAAQLRQEIALRLLSANGSVSAEEVADAFSREWMPPTEEQLNGHVAAKAKAAVDHGATQLELAQQAPSRLVDKVAKYEALLAEARDELAQSYVAREDAEAEHDETVQLAEYALGLGDPSLAPAATETAAHARAADVGVKGSEK